MVRAYKQARKQAAKAAAHCSPPDTTFTYPLPRNPRTPPPHGPPLCHDNIDYPSTPCAGLASLTLKHVPGRQGDCGSRGASPKVGAADAIGAPATKQHMEALLSRIADILQLPSESEALPDLLRSNSTSSGAGGGGRVSGHGMHNCSALQKDVGGWGTPTVDTHETLDSTLLGPHRVTAHKLIDRLANKLIPTQVARSVNLTYVWNRPFRIASHGPGGASSGNDIKSLQFW
jgi:hypothetical protein